MLMQPPPDEPPAILWTRPASNPFRGTRAEAIALLGIPTPPDAMQCRLREISDGERFAAMTFGRRSVEFDVVADTARWPASASRWADDCMYIASGREWHLIRPLACGNWSVEWFQIGSGPATAPGGMWSESGRSSWSGEDTAGGWGAPWGYSGIATGMFPSGAAFVAVAATSASAGFPVAFLAAAGTYLTTPGLFSAPPGSGSPGTPTVPTPEPATLWLLISGLIMTGLLRILHGSERRSVTMARRCQADVVDDRVLLVVAENR